MEIKLIDVISYSLIIILLIVFVLQIQDRNRLEYLNAKLRLRNCNIPEESLNSIIHEFMSDNYSSIEGVGDNFIPFHI